MLAERRRLDAEDSGHALRQPPVPAAEQLHDARHEQRAHDRHVDEDRRREAEAELLEADNGTGDGDNDNGQFTPPQYTNAMDTIMKDALAHIVKEGADPAEAVAAAAQQCEEELARVLGG